MAMKEFVLKFKDLDEVHQLQNLRDLISTTDEKIVSYCRPMMSQY